ncbi:hypothetical protein O181_024138 [Austropuccinia psidii MF-1]|uniref:Uncharacterized protein n=1 Tax=Austropuccinia psidii MF-1 TaxID=1389203 RepID=A0A9Q3CK64_9BASI|nr:hypothetical protein [Austropuccinia psidii MF-1]
MLISYTETQTNVESSSPPSPKKKKGMLNTQQNTLKQYSSYLLTRCKHDNLLASRKINFQAALPTTASSHQIRTLLYIGSIRFIFSQHLFGFQADFFLQIGDDESLDSCQRLSF